MTQQRGVNSSIRIGFEDVYGTAAVDGFVIPFNSCGVVGSKTRNVPNTISGTRNAVEPFSGNNDVGGSIVVPADSEAMAYWCYAMFGPPTSTGGPNYVHEYKVGDTMPSFTLEKVFTDVATDIYERYVGCKVSTFAITAGGDGELVCNMDIMGAGMSHETSSFDTNPTTVTIDRVNNFDAALKEGGATISNATEVSINVNFGLDGNSFVIGDSGTRGDIPEGLVAVTGNLKALFEDDTLLDKATGDTESSLTLTLTDEASSVFELEIQELLYAVNGVPIEGPQGLLVSLDFSGYYANGAEASSIVARVTNGNSAYADLETSSSTSPSSSESPSVSPS